MEDTMARINRFLNERAKGEKYATLFYCTINRAGLLCWANAGHPKPFLVRTNGEMIPLATTGMPLGMLETAQYSAEEIQLQRGDKVVIYSDGLSEAENEDGARFDKSGMREAIRAHASASCAAMHQGILQAFERFTEATVQGDDTTGHFHMDAPSLADATVQGDDVTLVVLEYAGA